MGILPLEFKNGDTRESYAIDGTETFDVKGEITHCSEMTLIIPFLEVLVLLQGTAGQMVLPHFRKEMTRSRLPRVCSLILP